VAAVLQHPELLQQQLASYQLWITLWLAQQQQQQQHHKLWTQVFGRSTQNCCSASPSRFVACW
jgi:hypothetical protein